MSNPLAPSGGLLVAACAAAAALSVVPAPAVAQSRVYAGAALAASLAGLALRRWRTEAGWRRLT